MKPLKLNMSKFKKVGGDEHHTVMRHQDGHEMRIAHKALSPEYRKQFLDLPMAEEKVKEQKPQMMYEGGQPQPKPSPTDSGPPEIDKKKAEDFIKGFNNPDPIVRKVKEYFGMADGGEIQATSHARSGRDYEYENARDKYLEALEIQKRRATGDYGDPSNKTIDPQVDSEVQSRKAGYEKNMAYGGNALDSLDLNANSSPASAPDQSSMPQPQMPQQPVINVNVGGAAPQQQAPMQPAASLFKVPPELQAQDAAALANSNLTQMQASGLPPQPPIQQEQQDLSGDAPSGGNAPSGLAQNIPTTQGIDPNDPYGYGQQVNTMQGGINQQLTGIREQAGANKAIAHDELEQYQKEQEGLNAIAKTINDSTKEIHGHISEVQEGMGDGTIDPNRLWHNKSIPGKVATAIGLILGGAGAGMTGQENLAYKTLQAQIDRDVDAQKASFGQKKTLLDAYYHQLGDMRDSANMVRVSLAQASLNMAKVAAAKRGDALSAAQANMLEGKLKTDYAPVIAQTARNQAMIKLMSDANQNPDKVPGLLNGLRIIDPEKAKEMQERFVPGVGLANVPVPPAVREQLVAHKQLDDAARDLLNWTKTHTTLAPGTSDYNTGVQKSLVVQQLVRQGQLGTVYRPGEQPLLDKVVNSNPAGFLKSFSTEPKLKELIQSNARQYNTLRGSLGIQGNGTVNALPPEQQKFLDWAKKNPQDSRAKIILDKLNAR